MAGSLFAGFVVLLYFVLPDVFQVGIRKGRVLIWLEQVESLGSVEEGSTYYSCTSLAICLVPVGIN